MVKAGAGLRLWPGGKATILPMGKSKFIESKIKSMPIIFFEVKVMQEYRLLGCGAMWVYYKPTFQRNVPPQSSG
jgi:hypothetical protein